MCQDWPVSGERTYGGASAQQRHDERRERLIRAVFDLLATDGTTGLTIRKVAVTAGVSPRYVYEDFTDLDDLRCQSFDSAAEEITGLVLDAVADLPPDPRVQLTAVFDAGARFAVEQPHKARFLLADSFGDPVLAQRRQRVSDTFAVGFSFYVRDYLPDPDAPGPAVELAARMLVGAATEIFTSWLNGSLKYSRQQLVDDMVDLFLGPINALTRIHHDTR